MSRSVFRDPRIVGSLALLLSCGAWVNIQYNSFLFEARGLRPDQIGLVNAIGAVASLFSPLLAGWWSDRSGRPQLVLTVYFLATAILLCILPHLRGIGGLAPGYFLLQVAFLPVAPLSQAIVLTRSCRDHGDFLAIRAMGTFGFFLVTILLWSTLRSPALLSWAYAGMAILLVASLPVFRVVSAIPSRARETSPLRLEEIVGFLWRRDLRVVYWGGGFGFLASSMATSVLGNFVTGPLGGEVSDISRAWAFATGFEMLLMFAAIPFLKRFGVRRLMLLGFASMCVRWLWVGLAPNYTVFLGAQVLHGVMVVGFFTGQNLFLAKLLPRDRVSSGTALASVLNGGVMSILGMFLAGQIWQHFGLRTVYFTTACVSLAAFAIFWKTAPDPGRGSSDEVDVGLELEP